MTARFEVFDKLRELGNTLDKTSSSLSSLNEPEQNSKARACLHLRETLAEVKSFKEDAKKNIAATKTRFSFEEFLASYEKQAERMKGDIENLEDYLTKYGFQKQKEPDFLSTPIQPKTFTKFMQDPCVEKETDPTHTPDVKEPFPPGTTTPMIKPGKSWEGNNGPKTPDTSSELPAQPATRTPMIRAISFNESPASEASRMSESLADNFPTPPTFATPGFQRKQGEETLSEHIKLETPPPPCFSSIDLLDPDDTHPMPTAADLGSNKTDSNAEDGPAIALPSIDEEAFLMLPGCLQRQFSLEQVNHLIGKTNKYIVSKGDRKPVSDGELMSVLDLGPRTRAFVLLMIKLNYLTIVSNGLYKVL